MSTNVEWVDSDQDSSEEWEHVTDDPRNLTTEEIDDIVSGLCYRREHSELLENSLQKQRHSLRRKLETKKVRPSKIPELKQIIIRSFYQALVAPGEAVGVNAAQCIGEPTTQLTLNSVSPTERILIQDGGVTKVVEIGPWIDELIANSSAVEHIPENRTEYLELTEPIWTQSPSKDGTVSWEKVTAVTKHKPVGDLVKITTKTGRQVTVTQSKSLLVWDSKEFVQRGGATVQKGDLIPVIANFPQPLQTNDQMLPSNLDGEFGLIVGLYLAKGLATNTFVEISNNDRAIQEIVKAWCDKYSITYHTHFQNTDIKIHSVLIAQWFKRWFGTENQNKKIPPQVFTAPQEFVRGLLDGYFSGNGTINKHDLVISSASKELITGFGILCTRFGIIGTQSVFPYKYSIRNEFAIRWAKLIGSSHPEKNRLLETIAQQCCYTTEYGIQNDVILDPIIKIERVPATEFVYDLTVPTTTNFSTWDGLGIADTFHSTGISAKNVTLGFPRAKELFNATSAPANPTCTVYFTKYNQSPEELHKVIDRMVQVRIDELISDWNVYSPEDYKPEWWQKTYCKLHDTIPEAAEDEWCLRLYFIVEKLYEHNITVKEIAKIIDTRYSDLRCIPSPLNIGIIDVLADCEEITIEGSRSRELQDITDNTAACKFYMYNIVSPEVRSLKAGGVDGILKLYPRKVKSSEYGQELKPEIKKRLKHSEEWIVDTDGTNLREILKLPYVDTTRTLSNDMWEIYQRFGIEAARAYLKMEFTNIVSFGGTYINPRHIGILVDKMTYTGQIRAIARFGVETSQYGPITRASFEEVMKHVITSAIFSERDGLNGISSNIALGTKIRAGTGFIKLKEIPIKVAPRKRSEEIITEEL